MLVSSNVISTLLNDRALHAIGGWFMRSFRELTIW